MNKVLVSCLGYILGKLCTSGTSFVPDTRPFVFPGFISKWLTTGQPRASSWTFTLNYGENNSHMPFLLDIWFELKLYEIVFYKMKTLDLSKEPVKLAKPLPHWFRNWSRMSGLSLHTPWKNYRIITNLSWPISGDLHENIFSCRLNKPLNASLRRHLWKVFWIFRFPLGQQSLEYWCQGLAFIAYSLLIDVFYEKKWFLAPDNGRKSHVYQYFHFEKPFGQIKGDRAAALAGGRLECCLVLTATECGVCCPERRKGKGQSRTHRSSSGSSPKARKMVVLVT